MVNNFLFYFFKGVINMLDQDPTNLTTITTPHTEERPHLFHEEKYQLLRQFQQEVFREIELLPSIRKLVNELITPENLAKIKPKYLEFFNM